MLVIRRHHCPFSVRGPKSAPNAIACCADGVRGDTPRSTMMMNTITFNPSSPVVIGKEGIARPCREAGIPARAVCASRSSHSGQFSEAGESPKLRSNSFPQCGQRCMGLQMIAAFRKWPRRIASGSMDLLGFSLHLVHQQVLAEGVRRSEIGLAAAHLRDFLNEVDEAVVASKHEGVDHDARTLAFVDFFEGLADNERIQAESVFVDAAVFERESGGFSVGDHDDLAHFLFLTEHDALR